MARIRALFTLAFWLDAAERAVKTFAQAASTTMLASGALDLFSADWGDIAAVGGLAAVASILTSIASAPVAGVSAASALPAGLG